MGISVNISQNRLKICSFRIRILCIYAYDLKSNHNADFLDEDFFSGVKVVQTEIAKVYKVRKFKDFYVFCLCSNTTVSTCVVWGNIS